MQYFNDYSELQVLMCWMNLGWLRSALAAMPVFDEPLAPLVGGKGSLEANNEPKPVPGQLLPLGHLLGELMKGCANPTLCSPLKA